MNLYLVQYTSNSGMVEIWAQAHNHLDAAASVLIDRGFDSMLHQQSDPTIKVVCRDSCRVGIYPKSHVVQYADGILGLTCFPDDPADSWKD